MFNIQHIQPQAVPVRVPGGYAAFLPQYFFLFTTTTSLKPGSRGLAPCAATIKLVQGVRVYMQLQGRVLP